MARRTSRTRRLLGVLIVVLIVAVGLAIAWPYVSPLGWAGSEDAPPAPQTEPTDPEPDLPGEWFQASGTMLSLPGAPSLPINLWDTPDRSSEVIRVVGKLPPGRSVTVTRRYRAVDENQFYYRVHSGELVGWLPETLVRVVQ